MQLRSRTYTPVVAGQRPTRGRISRTWPRDFRVAASRRHAYPKGLRNPSNFCYRRALQQCLLNLPSFVNLLELGHGRCNPLGDCVLCSFVDLEARYWNDNNAITRNGALHVMDTAFAAKVDQGTIFVSNGGLDPTRQQDVHEFMTLLMDQLRSEAPHSGAL